MGSLIGHKTVNNGLEDSDTHPANIDFRTPSPEAQVFQKPKYADLCLKTCVTMIVGDFMTYHCDNVK